MKIIIGADLVPTQTNYDLFSEGKINELFGDELLQIFDRADYRIFNLETPLTDDEKPIVKCGPNLIAPTSTICGYKKINVDLLTLANNHILDQGVEGMNSTCKILSENGIDYIGVGSSRNEAEKTKIIEINRKKIGLYACAEHEFSIVDCNHPGANPYDRFYSNIAVKKLKESCDFVIVLYHGGKEYYRYPSPKLQDNCRLLVENGANLVICQHSHCIGCEEEYLNSKIVYGQGNTLFDLNANEFWETSLLIEINDDFEIKYIPLRKKGNVERIASPDEAKMIINSFNIRSNQIKDEDFIKSNYYKFSEEKFENYMLTILGIKKNIFSKIINKIFNHKYFSWKIGRIYKKNNYTTLYNFIACEAHRELIESFLKQRMS